MTGSTDTLSSINKPEDTRMSEIHSTHIEDCVPTSSGPVAESAKVLLRRVFRILRGCGIKMDTLREMTGSALIAEVAPPVETTG
jgi:hypothetical protein